MSEVFRPYLVQRILKNSNPHPDRKGVDKYFKFDYMGSAEFEFGALPKSIREMRNLKISEAEPMEFYTTICKTLSRAWYVGPRELAPAVNVFFMEELDGRGPRLKERTRISHVYGTANNPLKRKPSVHDPIGWWDINQNYAFFTTKEHAENWIKGLCNK